MTAPERTLMSIFGKPRPAAPGLSPVQEDGRTNPVSDPDEPTQSTAPYGQEDSSGDQVGAEPVLPLSLGADQLFDRLSRAAMGLLEIIEDRRLGPDGKPIYSLPERLKAFSMCQDWLAKANRMRPPEQQDAPGVEMLKQIMETPALTRELERQGFMRRPVPKNKGGQVHKDATADDSKLHDMVHKPPTSQRRIEHMAKMRAVARANKQAREQEDAQRETMVSHRETML